MLDEEKPWITPDLLLLVRQKDEMQEWANKCPSLVAEFRKFRNHVRMKIRKAKVEYEDPTGEKRDEEFRQRMMKKGLTPDEIEKRKNMQNRPETHHGGKKYEPPIMYPGNLATGSTAMKVGTSTNTMSVTRDPEVVQQKAKFVNLLSKQSKTVYDSYRTKDVSSTNWSENQSFGQTGNRGWNNQGFAPNSQVPSSNFVKPLNYTQTQQGYSQSNAANWQNSTGKTNQQNWQKNSNQQQQWGSSGKGNQDYTWSSNYNYKTGGHNAPRNQYGGNKSDESKQNPWQEAMAEYWQQAAQESSFGKSQETSSALQSSVSQNQSVVSQTRPSSSQTLSFSNQQFASHTQQSASQSLPFTYQPPVSQSQPPANQTLSFSNQQFASHTQQSTNQSLPFAYQPPVNQSQPPASQTLFSNQQFASNFQQSANQSLPFTYQPPVSQTQSSSNQALSFSNQQFATQTQQSTNQTVPNTYQTFVSQTQPTAGQTPSISNQQLTYQTQSSVDHSQNTVTSTENKSSESSQIKDHLSCGPEPGANKEIEKPVSDTAKELKVLNNPSKQSSQSSKLGKRNQVPNIQQMKDKPPVQYFKGVAKNKNKIQIRINPKSAFGVEVEKESDEKESNVEEMESSEAEKESDVSEKSESQVEKTDVSSMIYQSSGNENPWQQEIQKFWENAPKDLGSEASQQAIASQSNMTDAQTEPSESKDESNAQSKANESKSEIQTNEMSQKNDQGNKTKSEVSIEDIPLPCETEELKPVNQSLIESQKQALEKVTSSKPLKDKNWSESMEICDQDVEELNLSTDNYSHYFPHPATISPSGDFTESNSDGYSLSTSYNDRTSYNDPFGQGDFKGNLCLKHLMMKVMMGKLPQITILNTEANCLKL